MNSVSGFSSLQWAAAYRKLGVELAPRTVAERSLADYVAAHAKRQGSLPCMDYLGTRLTYAELDRHANRLANFLRTEGVRKGDIVGIHLPNTPQYLIALVAASKLGAVVTGVSPLLSASELRQQLTDSGVKVLLTLDMLFAEKVMPNSGHIPSLDLVLVSSAGDFFPVWKRVIARLLGKLNAHPLPEVTGFRVVALLDALAAASDAEVQTPARYDESIYIQYTGGTTGKPKGAELTLRSVFSGLTQLQAFAAMQEGKDTLASAFPYFHTAGLALATLGLQHAARILVIPDPRNVDAFCAAMRRHPPTFMVNVPTLYQMLLDCRAFQRVDFSRLRMAVSGAAPFAKAGILRLEAIIGRGKLCEGYGLTEASGVSVINPPGRTKAGSVGVPLPGVRVKIVDIESGVRELPPDEPGEIIINAPQIMAGYLGNPEATRATLRELEGELWLYTGDIGSMDEEGYITISDRSKDMLIVGGYKVFSVEIEARLDVLDFVDLCAIVGTPDIARPGNDVVHLYVQLTSAYRGHETKALRAEILRFCRENMAPYKVPKLVHFVDAMPLTAVGKLDKKVLRKAMTVSG